MHIEHIEIGRVSIGPLRILQGSTGFDKVLPGSTGFVRRFCGVQRVQNLVEPRTNPVEPSRTLQNPVEPISNHYDVENIINLTSSTRRVTIAHAFSRPCRRRRRRPDYRPAGLRSRQVTAPDSYRNAAGAVTQNRADGPLFLEERGQRASRVSG